MYRWDRLGSALGHASTENLPILRVDSPRSSMATACRNSSYKRSLRSLQTFLPATMTAISSEDCIRVVYSVIVDSHCRRCTALFVLLL